MSGDELAPVLPRLLELAGELDLTVTFEEMKYLQDGLYHKATGRIAIRRDLSVNARVMTLVHELGHALLDAEPRAGDPRSWPGLSVRCRTPVSPRRWATARECSRAH